MTFLMAFLIGGALCMIAQIVMDLTRLTPAHILVGGVVMGVILGGIGIYEPFAKFAGAGATIPLPGFGYSMVAGIIKEIPKEGWVSVFSGAFKATGAGIKAALIFGVLAAFFVRARA
ncbi:MAG: stage V sporulation protein AE [Thermaerobacter sp.]|nr:stage V sporulation protein AE [Thermaerobacter sp.]